MNAFWTLYYKLLGKTEPQTPMEKRVDANVDKTLGPLVK